MAGPHGERNITDFLHVIEVMDSCGSGRGCSATQALMTFSTLANMDGRHELVSRREDRKVNGTSTSSVLLPIVA